MEDGSIEIEGEKVDNPEDYKGEPVPGGPKDDSTLAESMGACAPSRRELPTTTSAARARSS